jgi:hypothetical protein
VTAVKDPDNGGKPKHLLCTRTSRKKLIPNAASGLAKGRDRDPSFQTFPPVKVLSTEFKAQYNRADEEYGRASGQLGDPV